MYSGTSESNQIVRLVLSGSVFFLKVSGQASVELLKFISAAASEESKASGKVRLKSLLQSGSELKVFTLQGMNGLMHLRMLQRTMVSNTA